MDQQTYIIKFDDVTAAQASLYANELGNKLLNAAPEIDIEHRRIMQTHKTLELRWFLYWERLLSLLLLKRLVTG